MLQHFKQYFFYVQIHENVNQPCFKILNINILGYTFLSGKYSSLLLKFRFYSVAIKFSSDTNMEILQLGIHFSKYSMDLNFFHCMIYVISKNAKSAENQVT